MDSGKNSVDPFLIDPDSFTPVGISFLKFYNLETSLKDFGYDSLLLNEEGNEIGNICFSLSVTRSSRQKNAAMDLAQVEIWVFKRLMTCLSSPEPKAQVSFSHQNLSVVRRCRCCRLRCKLFTFSFSSPEPPGQF